MSAEISAHSDGYRMHRVGRGFGIFQLFQFAALKIHDTGKTKASQRNKMKQNFNKISP
jgi:hypothetical protein